MTTKKARSKVAQDLGRRGGLKGGAARAASMTSEQRSEVAKRGAVARWGREMDGETYPPTPAGHMLHTEQQDEVDSDPLVKGPRLYTNDPAGPLELVVMSLGRFLYEARKSPFGPWLTLPDENKLLWGSRECGIRGIDKAWVIEGVRRERNDDRTDKR